MTPREAPQPDPVIDPGDFPGLGADAARYINEHVCPEWRALHAATVAAAPPLSDEVLQKLATAFGLRASQPSRKAS